LLTAAKRSAEKIRVMSYNIHSCVNMDGSVRPQRIARVIGTLKPDLVALQEVDAGIPRTYNQHQAALLGEKLKMHSFFFPILDAGGQKYGLAVLSRFQKETVICDRLPVMRSLKLQQRGVIGVTLATAAGKIHFINTHLSLFGPERRLQIRHLLEIFWKEALPANAPVIFCGDLNAGSRSYVYRRLNRLFSDVQIANPEGTSPRPTFSSRRPMFRIDHIFVSDHFQTVTVDVPINADTQSASDHLPLYVELALKSRA
jgi:endonuclease/exonuclease/phosphatase family metal-dependent hydrolase